MTNCLTGCLGLPALAPLEPLIQPELAPLYCLWPQPLCLELHLDLSRHAECGQLTVISQPLAQNRLYCAAQAKVWQSLTQEACWSFKV